MPKKYQKIIVLTVMILVFFSFAHDVFALNENYVPLAPLPCIGASGTNCVGNGASGSTKLSEYIPNLFNFIVGIAAVLAFIMITMGGITYATSDAISGKSKGREYIENALWGLLLVIGAWVILNTINPQILKFDLLIPNPNITTSSTGVVSGTVCTNCQSIGTLPTNGNTGGYVEAGLLVKLNSFNSQMNAANIGWVITEAYPPTVIHRDPCHLNGTCIDARPVNQTVANINTFHNTAKAAGLNPQYEVPTQAAKTSLVASGVTIPIIVVPGINNAHFSVYK